MLVDLERNDLGRVCSPGSVRVMDRFSVERYSHVMHIVSEVRGELAPNKNAYDALAALFPGGTITGCPKIKSTEIIEKLEGVSRGPFYGSAGFFTGAGDAVFNILIRTALVRRGKIYLQAGAGIVADSDTRREYREVLAKARVLLESA
jgi:anthranilate/para-aminobenzoate synthase component I